MGKDITVKSMVASRTGEPAVSFRLADCHVNMPPADARKVGVDLIAAADRAELEAKVVAHMRASGADEGTVVAMLSLLRAADAG